MVRSRVFLLSAFDFLLFPSVVAFLCYVRTRRGSAGLIPSPWGEGLEFGHFRAANPQGCQGVAGSRRGFFGDGDLRVTAWRRCCIREGMPERWVVARGSGTSPRCTNPKHAFRGSFANGSERPPATICQPSGLVCVLVGRMFKPRRLPGRPDLP